MTNPKRWGDGMQKLAGIALWPIGKVIVPA
jgi:hypothetical protein